MLNTIYARRSIRSYDPRPVEAEKVEEVLRAAMYAPSARNRRPWHFVVVDDRVLLEKIMEVHPHSKMLRTAPVCVLVCGDRAQEAPGYHIIDCAAATQNMLLAACALGLGTCWLGVEPRRERMEPIAELFSLPEGIVPFALVALGYPAEAPARPERFDALLVHKNKW